MSCKFSVITVCYNSEKTIEKTLKSVLAQTYQNFEYIIIDGKSTDGTMEIIKRYEPEFGDKLRYVSEKDNGIYDAMNKGIAMATGELVGIVNSDDYYEPDALENILKAYEGYEYSIVYGMLRKVIGGKEVSVYFNHDEFLDKNMITHPTCFVSKKLYDDFGMYSMDYRYSADYEFMLRMKRNEKVRFFRTYDIISNFSIDGASSSIRAYEDTMKLKREYNLMSKKEYKLQMLKCKVSKLLRR